MGSILRRSQSLLGYIIASRRILLDRTERSGLTLPDCIAGPSSLLEGDIIGCSRPLKGDIIRVSPLVHDSLMGWPPLRHDNAF